MTNNNVVAYYRNDYDEAIRHSDPFGIIQEMRTRELIGRYLHKDNMAILDVGGANGVYSFYLADLGHSVSLLDMVPNHIEKAREIDSGRASKLQNIMLGDAQTFEPPQKEYEIIILHGPLYHLVEKDKRINVLRRMKGFLSSDGVVLGFGINRFAGYFYGIRTGHILDEKYRASVREEMRTGIRKKNPGWYFHKPSEMMCEYREAGLSPVAIKSVTTQVWMLPGIESRVKNFDSMKDVLDLAREAEDYVEIGQDILCVGKAE